MVFAAVAWASMSTAFAANADADATIRQMMDGFNKGDIAAVKAAHVASPTIIDNVPPFRWSGPGAFDQWLADLTKAEASEGKTDGKVTFAPIVDKIIRGDRAYLVARSIYTFKQKGLTRREDGYTAFVLVRTGAEWKVESWSWASPAATGAK